MADQKTRRDFFLVGGPTVNLTFSVDLDSELAARLLRDVGGDPEAFNNLPNRTKVQYLAPILWTQLKRHLDQRPKNQR